MQYSFRNEVGQYTKTDREKVKFNKRLLIYLFFLIIATLFWFLNALNKNYAVNIEFPVRFYNFPSDKVLVSDLPLKLKLRINGHGFTIIKHKFYAGISPLKIDVQGAGAEPMNDSTKVYYLLSRRIRERLVPQIGEDLQVLNVYPDSLFFTLDSIINKPMAVKPNIQLQFKKQFMQKGKPIVSPESIMVFGPKVVVDSMKFAYTELYTKKKLSDTLKVSLKLKPVKTVRYGVENVSITVPVENYTEANVTVPIEVINLPDNLILRTFPGYITVSGVVAISDYPKMKPGLFKVTVDYKQTLNSSSSRLKVTLLQSPDFMARISFAPKAVEYIIEK